MNIQTALDEAFVAMEAAPNDDAPRLAFYGRLSEGILFLLLDREVQGETVEPRLFPLDEGPFVLAFDTEERLAEFAAGPAPYAALPGRQVAQMLADQRIGLALNLGGAPSEMLLPPDAVAWLAQTADDTPRTVSQKIDKIAPPGDLPRSVLAALDRALARTSGLARTAYLCGVTYDTGALGHLVAFIDPVAGAEEALAQAIQGALTFSGAEAAALDVAFVNSSDAMAAHCARWGLRFDLPAEVSPDAASPDPKAPPRLR